MGLINFLHPVTAYENLVSAIKDVSNYRFYRNQVATIEKRGFFKTMKMRVDWLKRVYYIVNLEPETLLAGQDVADLEKSRVFDSLSLVKGVISEYNLSEVINISTKRIKTEDVYAYLVWIKYKITTTKGKLFQLITWSVLAGYLVHLLFYGYKHIDQIIAFVNQFITAK